MIQELPTLGGRSGESSSPACKCMAHCAFTGSRPTMRRQSKGICVRRKSQVLAISAQASEHSFQGCPECPFTWAHCRS